MGETNDFSSLITQLMWIREVLLEQLRKMRERLGDVAGGEQEQLNEYADLLRQIILATGELIDRIQVDEATDDPKPCNEAKADFGSKL